jgi:hypothetical protein
MYSASRADLENVIQWLRSNDESQWDDQISLLSETISKLQRMARPIRRPEKTGSRSAESNFFSIEANAITVAMPQLRNMLSAMRSRNRPAAIESGEAALSLLPRGFVAR